MRDSCVKGDLPGGFNESCSLLNALWLELRAIVSAVAAWSVAQQ
jgi:hypothetical protein